MKEHSKKRIFEILKSGYKEVCEKIIELESKRQEIDCFIKSVSKP